MQLAYIMGFVIVHLDMEVEDVKTVSNGFNMNKYFNWIHLDLGCNAGGNLSCSGEAKYCMKDGNCGNSI